MLKGDWMYDFFSTALPWIVLALTLAIISSKYVLFDGQGAKNQEKIGNEEVYGMCLGLCVGIVLSTTVTTIPLSYGASFGMLIGMIIGIVLKRQ